MLIAHVAEEAAAAFNFTPIIAAGTAFAVFLVLGIVCWSYRDVYNRHSDKTGGDAHSTGH
jgi:hypothetical protein